MAESGSRSRAPSPLKDRLRSSPNAPSMEGAIRAAEEKIKREAPSFFEDLDNGVAALDAIEEAHPAQQPLPEQTVTEIFRISHDLRGEAGTFGYPLVTLVADSLCKFLEDDETRATKKRSLFTLHLQALRRIRDEDIRGDGGAVGQEFRQFIASLER
jgi:chemotaxis protein histidine kinase CheA